MFAVDELNVRLEHDRMEELENNQSMVSFLKQPHELLLCPSCHAARNLKADMQIRYIVVNRNIPNFDSITRWIIVEMDSSGTTYKHLRGVSKFSVAEGSKLLGFPEMICGNACLIHLLEEGSPWIRWLPLIRINIIFFPFILLSNVYRNVALVCCGDRETSQFPPTIQIAIYLWVVIVIVCVSRRVLNFRHMGMSSCVCRPLDESTNFVYTRCDALQELQLGDEPIVNWFLRSHPCT
jgi:hypothetical protein